MPLSPPSISPPREAEEARSMSSREGEIHEEFDPKEEERVLRKAFLCMTDMVGIFIKKGMRNWKENDPNFTRKDMDI